MCSIKLDGKLKVSTFSVKFHTIFFIKLAVKSSNILECVIL
jgi:hypothetical protein